MEWLNGSVSSWLRASGAVVVGEAAILASSSSWAWRGGGLVGHEFAGGACIEGLGSMGLVVRGTCHGLLCVGSRGWGSWLGLVAVSSGLDGDGVLGEASGGLVVECACPYGAVGPVDAGFGACGSLGLECGLARWDVCLGLAECGGRESGVGLGLTG